MLEGLDLWKLLGGLGMFLLGMYLMEEAINKLSGRAFKRLIRKFTTGRIKSVLAGLSATAILQSSSAVSLMTLAFVGAGIMSMENGIGVILGTNIGTTTTAWIVATVGFKFDIENFALPFLFLGGIAGVFFGKSERYSNIAKLFAGFGLLFLGLDFMKESVEVFAQQFDMSIVPQYGLVVGLLVGILLTALMQSSSATIAIALTLLHSKLFTFNMAAAMVIGANVGTTVTILLGALGGLPVKKRVAFSHFIFNITTGLIALILLPVLIWLLLDIFALRDKPILALALFHTVFNLLGVLLFLPFIKLFAKLLNRLFPDKTIKLTQYIDNTPPEVVEAALAALKNESLYLLNNILKYNLRVLNIDVNLVFADYDYRKSSPTKGDILSYEDIKRLQAEIITYSATIQIHDTNQSESITLQRYTHGIRMMLHAAKTLKDIQHNFDAFKSEDNVFLNEQYQHFRKRLIATYFKIVAILAKDSASEQSETILSLLTTLKKEDELFLTLTNQAINNKKIGSINLSTALLANRAFVQSSRQVLLSMRELLLEEEQLKAWDSEEMMIEQGGK